MVVLVAVTVPSYVCSLPLYTFSVLLPFTVIAIGAFSTTTFTFFDTSAQPCVLAAVTVTS